MTNAPHRCVFLIFNDLLGTDTNYTPLFMRFERSTSLALCIILIADLRYLPDKFLIATWNPTQGSPS